MSYVDGFVVPVPAGNKEAYLKASRKMTTICKRYGADPHGRVLGR